jgi:regulator of sirC expression with transglutaminase-like and TPR domain
MERTVVRSAGAGRCRIGIVSPIGPVERFHALFLGGAPIVELNDAIAAALGRDPSGSAGVRAAAETCRASDAGGIVSHLWAELGLRGDVETYDSVSNSFVGEVLERRRGIPIALAAVAMGVGDALGIPLDGIGMPGHFLVRERGGAGRFFDPFHGPEPLDEHGCRRLCASVTGGERWSDAYLAPVTVGAMALRMLTNLKSAYRRMGDERSLRTVMLLRRTFLGDAEREEFARMMRARN